MILELVLPVHLSSEITHGEGCIIDEVLKGIFHRLKVGTLSRLLLGHHGADAKHLRMHDVVDSRDTVDVVVCLLDVRYVSLVVRRLLSLKVDALL